MERIRVIFHKQLLYSLNNWNDIYDFRQIYLKEIPFEQEDKNVDTTSRIVDVDKAIENGNGTGSSQKMATSFKQSTRSSTNKKTSKEKCKIM